MPFEYTYSLYEAIKKYGDIGIKETYEYFISSNNELLLTLPISFPLINSRYKRGSNLGRNIGRTEEELDNIKTDKFGESTELNVVQIEYLNRLIDLCSDNGINIIFVETPKYISAYEQTEYIEVMGEYINLLNGRKCQMILSDKIANLCDTKDGCIVYEFDYKDASRYIDLIHMSYEGRVAFSEILREITGGTNCELPMKNIALIGSRG